MITADVKRGFVMNNELNNPKNLNISSEYVKENNISLAKQEQEALDYFSKRLVWFKGTKLYAVEFKKEAFGVIKDTLHDLSRDLAMTKLENDKLRGLLKECLKEIKPLWDNALYDNPERMPYSDRFLKLDNLKTQIDEVLNADTPRE